MRFMMLMYPGVKAESGALAPAAGVAAMASYNSALVRAGVLLACDGLRPSAQGVRIWSSGGKRTVVDGPFTEAKEVVGGYWLIQVRSREEALEWASRIPLDDDQMVEVREVYELNEVVADAPPPAEPEKAARKGS